MELIYKDKKIFLKQKRSVKKIIEQINILLGDSDIFSHLEIDGVEVYDDIECYIQNHLIDLSEILIILKTAKEIRNDILVSAEKYLENAMPTLSTLVNEFYNNPSSETWIKFSEMLEGMQWVNQVIVSLDQMQFYPSNWNEYLKLAFSLQQELKILEEAIISGDNVSIADIIQFELIDIYMSLKKEVQKTIDTEGVRIDVN